MAFGQASIDLDLGVDWMAPKPTAGATSKTRQGSTPPGRLGMPSAFGRVSSVVITIVPFQRWKLILIKAREGEAHMLCCDYG